VPPLQVPHGFSTSSSVRGSILHRYIQNHGRITVWGDRGARVWSVKHYGLVVFYFELTPFQDAEFVPVGQNSCMAFLHQVILGNGESFLDYKSDGCIIPGRSFCLIRCH
jgi:hypothetical protein